MITKCEQRAIETLINNYLLTEKALLVPFEWTICVKYNQRYTFFRQGRNAVETLENKYLTSDLPMRAETQNFSLKKKITKCEQRAIETLINNYVSVKSKLQHPSPHPPRIPRAFDVFSCPGGRKFD